MKYYIICNNLIRGLLFFGRNKECNLAIDDGALPLSLIMALFSFTSAIPCKGPSNYASIISQYIF